MDRSVIRDNIERVRESMAEAAAKAGRDVSLIELVGATKMQTAEAVAEAMPYLDAAGENRVQELVAKQLAGAYGNGTVDFIGHLQTNKVSKVAGKVRLIQSIGSDHLASAVSEYMVKTGGTQDILVEVNIGEEESKSGFAVPELAEAVQRIAELPGIKVRGLMSVPPILDKEADRRKVFASLYQLFIDIKAKKYDNVSMDFLSMGMSADFCDAIIEGSNMVRVGTAIFGARNYGVR